MIRESIPAGQVVRASVESVVLKDNPLGDPYIRDLWVYLPPGYEASDETYPVVYCLSGFTGRGQMMLNDSAFSPNLAERIDRLIESGRIRRMIAVLPDCFTYYGGSQYINSTATGRYEDYLSQEIVSFVDSTYRTNADRSSRAVMGKSSGGYGALIMGLRHADTFGLVCATAADSYFEYCYPNDFPKAFRTIKGDPASFMKELWASDPKPNDYHPALNTIGMAACFSPNGTEFELPFDPETGAMRAAVWSRWLQHDPVRLAEKHVEELRSLRLLFIDAGRRDEFSLDIGARIFSKRLTELGVDHIHEEFDGGHFNISHRQDRSLEMISQHLA